MFKKRKEPDNNLFMLKGVGQRIESGHFIHFTLARKMKEMRKTGPGPGSTRLSANASASRDSITVEFKKKRIEL